MEIVLTRSAAKALRKMPATDAARIRGKIEQLATAPESLAGNIKKLVGVDAFRLRVGDYRVIYSPDGTILNILAIGSRGSIY